MPAAYEQDFYAWSQQTAAALCEGRWHEVDACRVAEEIADLGKSERRALGSQLDRILMHLLKCRYQPERHTRSWDLSIAGARVEIRQLLRQSPSLRQQVPELLRDRYEVARLDAARETDLELSVFPEDCPFDVETVLER